MPGHGSSRLLPPDPHAIRVACSVAAPARRRVGPKLRLLIPLLAIPFLLRSPPPTAAGDGEHHGTLTLLAAAPLRAPSRHEAEVEVLVRWRAPDPPSGTTAAVRHVLTRWLAGCAATDLVDATAPSRDALRTALRTALFAAGSGEIESVVVRRVLLR